MTGHTDGFMASTNGRKGIRMKNSNRFVQGMDSILDILLKSGHSVARPVVMAGVVTRGGKRTAQQSGQYCSYPVYAKKTGW